MSEDDLLLAIATFGLVYLFLHGSKSSSGLSGVPYTDPFGNTYNVNPTDYGYLTGQTL